MCYLSSLLNMVILLSLVDCIDELGVDGEDDDDEEDFLLFIISSLIMWMRVVLL